MSPAFIIIANCLSHQRHNSDLITVCVWIHHSLCWRCHCFFVCLLSFRRRKAHIYWLPSSFSHLYAWFLLKYQLLFSAFAPCNVELLMFSAEEGQKRCCTINTIIYPCHKCSKVHRNNVFIKKNTWMLFSKLLNLVTLTSLWGETGIFLFIIITFLDLSYILQLLFLILQR